MSTIYKLPATGSGVVLHTHLQVRDDAHVLYGFATLEERSLFRELLKISGIGAKSALGILSGVGPGDFVAIVEAGDRDRLTKLPGIGKKTAERLLLEMRDKPFLDIAGGVAGGGGAPVGAGQEAVDALVALGYGAAEAKRMVKAVGDEAEGTEAVIREALRRAVR